MGADVGIVFRERSRTEVAGAKRAEQALSLPSPKHGGAIEGLISGDSIAAIGSFVLPSVPCPLTTTPTPSHTSRSGALARLLHRSAVAGVGGCHSLGRVCHETIRNAGSGVFRPGVHDLGGRSKMGSMTLFTASSRLWLSLAKCPTVKQSTPEAPALDCTRSAR